MMLPSQGNNEVCGGCDELLTLCDSVSSGMPQDSDKQLKRVAPRYSRDVRGEGFEVQVRDAVGSGVVAVEQRG